MSTRIRLAAVLVLVCSSLVAQEVQSIVLKDGSTLRGKIVGQQEGMLLLETSYGRLDVPMANIVRVEYGQGSMQPVTSPAQFVSPAAGLTPARFASGQGSSLIGGSMEFALFSGQLYGEYPIVLFALAPSYVMFVSRGIGLGADLSVSVNLVTYERYGYGGYYATTATYTGFAICPKAVAVFGDAGSKSLPFFGLGFGYARLHTSDEYSSTYDLNGMRFKASGGVMMQVVPHVGIPFEFGLVFDRFTHYDETEDGLTLHVGIGLVGILY